MKKLFFTTFLISASLFAVAGESPSSPKKVKNQKETATTPRLIVECCSTAEMQLPNGNLVTCTVCAETCSGPQGADARAADCLMDIIVQGG